MELLGPSLIVMAFETVILFIIHVTIELQWFQRLEGWLINSTPGNLKTGEHEDIEDEDVAKERERIEQNYRMGLSRTDNDILQTNGLTKVFRTTKIRSLFGLGSEDKVAVNNISVGIKRGECFGWLGLNGAGKSTTFKMLTNIFLATKGEFHLSFTDKYQQARIGYCPQVDSLDPLIQVEDLLRIYAKLKGIRKENIPTAVNKALKDMDLVSCIIMNIIV